MRLAVEPEVFQAFPGMRVVVAVARGLDNRASCAELDAGWRDAWRDAVDAAAHGNAQSHPRVRPWRERFRALGVSGKEFPSSIEALLRRALKGGEPFRINPLVDFYNSVSLRHVVPAGGYDLSRVEGLALRFTRAGDTFQSLDGVTPAEVAPGEVAYTDGTTVLTRHFVWRQARTGLIDESTTEVLLLSEVLGEVGEDVAAAVLAELRSGLESGFGVTPATWILDAQRCEISW